MSAVVQTLTRIKIGLEGLPPGLLQGGKGLMEADEGNKRPPRRTADEEARLRAHWMKNGKGDQLCIPWVMLYNSLCFAAGDFKFRGAKKMGAVVAATVSSEQDKIPLGTNKFETFAEYCRVPPRTGAMVKLGRPLIRKWACEFVIVVDAEMYQAEVLKDIFTHAGKMVGIGCWRPSLKGPYGRFVVTKFEVQK